MFKGKKILAIIPARGGSKGLPGKNIKNIAGKPLIYWTAKKAFESKHIDEVFISTDSIKIKDICEKMGFEIPALRPSEFAKDESPSYEVVIHAINFFKKLNKKFDYVLLLEPTSPLRKKTDIDYVIEKAINNPFFDTLVSVGVVQTEHPSIVKKINDNTIIPYYDEKNKFFQRQQYSEAFFPYGVAYMSKVSFYVKNKTFYSEKCLPFIIDRWQNYEIDDEIDFIINELLIKKYLK